MPKLSVETLTDAQETLLLPLWARALEASRSSPILQDPRALQIVESIDYDFSNFKRHEPRFIGFCIRSLVFDKLVRECLAAAQPQTTVVELGAGLDTRFERLDNGELSWYDLDLPAVAELRAKLFPSHPRRHLLSASLLEESWLTKLTSKDLQAPIFVAEGVLYFLSKRQLFELFARLSRRFPGCRILFDAQSPWYLRYSNLLHPLKNSSLQWSIGSEMELSRREGVQVEKYVSFGDPNYYPQAALDRLPWHERLAQRYLPGVKHFFKVFQVRLGNI